MIKALKHLGVHEIFGFIITLLSVKYGILKILSILVYVKKPVGFFFRRITTNGRDSPPLRKADDTPSPALPRARSRRLLRSSSIRHSPLDALDLGYPQLSLNQGIIINLPPLTEFLESVRR